MKFFLKFPTEMYFAKNIIVSQAANIYNSLIKLLAGKQQNNG